jgi:hypothetical protein
MEGFHVAGTHPQLLLQTCNTDLQVDVFGNVARAMQVNQFPSAMLPLVPTEQEMVDCALDVRRDADPTVRLAAGTSGREKMAQISREALRNVIGDRADAYCDAELVDSFYINIFPNIHPWAAFSRICFRFRPYGDDHQRCIMDVYILAPFKGNRPPPAEVHWLKEDEDWTKAPEIGGYLARILNQDLFNAKPGQDGLRASQRKTVSFSRYLESKIRHFYMLYEEHMGRP